MDCVRYNDGISLILAGLKKIVQYTDDFVIQGFVKLSVPYERLNTDRFSKRAPKDQASRGGPGVFHPFPGFLSHSDRILASSNLLEENTTNPRIISSLSFNLDSFFELKMYNIYYKKI